MDDVGLKNDHDDGDDDLLIISGGPAGVRIVLNRTADQGVCP